MSVNIKQLDEALKHLPSDATYEDRAQVFHEARERSKAIGSTEPLNANARPKATRTVTRGIDLPQRDEPSTQFPIFEYPVISTF
jgi:hypothetical protein